MHLDFSWPPSFNVSVKVILKEKPQECSVLREEKVAAVECLQLMFRQADNTHYYEVKMGVTVCRMSFSHVPKDFVFQDGSVFAVVQYLPVSSYNVMWNFVDK